MNKIGKLAGSKTVHQHTATKLLKCCYEYRKDIYFTRKRRPNGGELERTWYIVSYQFKKLHNFSSNFSCVKTACLSIGFLTYLYRIISRWHYTKSSPFPLKGGQSVITGRRVNQLIKSSLNISTFSCGMPINLHYWSPFSFHYALLLFFHSKFTFLWLSSPWRKCALRALNVRIWLYHDQASIIGYKPCLSNQLPLSAVGPKCNDRNNDIRHKFMAQ